MRRSRFSLLILATLAAGSACATEPGPTIAGTWHVGIGTLDSGSISPTSFDVVVTPSADTFLLTMPTLTWSGGRVYDVQKVVITFSSDTLAGFGARPSSPTIPCDAVELYGRVSPGRDTLRNAVVRIVDSSAVIGPSTVCIARWSGSITAHK